MALGALEARLQAAIARHGVPGASLAILADGRPHAAAAGVLHRGTGVQATTATLFQLGSIGKVYTTTQCLCLNERGLLDLDAPVGLICATASDLVAFAAMHLREPVLAAAREPQADVRDLSTWADAWGLGWMLFDWDGCRVFGHDGVTIGQHAFLRVVPEHGVAIALLTNGGMADDCFRELCGDLLAEVCGLRVSAPPEPAADVAADETLAGVYEHVRMRLTIVHGADRLVGRAEALDGLDFTGMAEVELDIRPLAAPGRYVVRGPGVAEQGHAWCPIGFPQIGGERYAHFGGRAMRRVA